MDEVVAQFQIHRNSIISYVYRLTGSWEESQDITQEVMMKYINYRGNKIEHPKTWMFKVATNLSWDFLKSARHKREVYKGPWLPEPYLNESYSLEEELELDESLSMALLVVMEKLTVKERISYILHDIFDFPYKEISVIINTSTENCRKLSSRARQKLKEKENKFTPTKEEHQHLTNTFLEAVKNGNMQELLSIFSDDIIFHSDGGGKATAAQKIIYGNHAVTLFLRKLVSKHLKNVQADTLVETKWFNGSLGIIMIYKTTIVTSFHFKIEKQKISAIYALRNPDKLKFFS